MRKLLSLVIGFALGAAVGATMVVLFTPTSGEELVDNIKRGFAETMAEARQASALRRIELEAELATLRTKSSRPALPPPA
jgi:gas vesicle protein